jgi:hypothetical protein
MEIKEMNERRYNLDDIDKMCTAIHLLHGGRDQSACEEELRTYMLAGVDPDDLHKKGQEYFKKWLEGEQHRRLRA